MAGSGQRAAGPMPPAAPQPSSGVRWGVIVLEFLDGLGVLFMGVLFVIVKGDACQHVWRTGSLPDAARLSSMILLAGPKQGLMG